MEWKRYAGALLLSAGLAAGCTNRESMIGIEVELPPSSWTARKDLNQQGEVLSINNFGGNYIHGGLLPQEGAEISIVATPIDTLSQADTAINEYLEGDTNSAKEYTKVAGCDARQVESEMILAPGLTYKRLGVFLPLQHSESLVFYKFFLSYSADESATSAQSFKGVFEDLLKSTKLKPSVKCLYSTLSGVKAD